MLINRRQALIGSVGAAAGLAIYPAFGEVPPLKKKDSYKVGFAQTESNNPWRLAQTASMKDEAAKRGCQIVYTDAAGSAAKQVADVNSMIAQAMKSHQDAVIRLAEVPGLGVDSAQQIIAEVGAQASTFCSAGKLTAWVGTCPGKEESAEQNHSSRSAKGNKYMRRVLNQAAHAAAAKKGSHFQIVFRRLLPRLGYQSAIWAVAHRLCRVVWKILHEGVRFIEKGAEVHPREKKKRAQMLARALRKLGYEVTITPINQLTPKLV